MKNAIEEAVSTPTPKEPDTTRINIFKVANGFVAHYGDYAAPRDMLVFSSFDSLVDGLRKWVNQD